MVALWNVCIVEQMLFAFFSKRDPSSSRGREKIMQSCPEQNRHLTKDKRTFDGVQNRQNFWNEFIPRFLYSSVRTFRRSPTQKWTHSTFYMLPTVQVIKIDVILKWEKKRLNHCLHKRSISCKLSVEIIEGHILFMAGVRIISVDGRQVNLVLKNNWNDLKKWSDKSCRIGGSDFIQQEEMRLRTTGSTIFFGVLSITKVNGQKCIFI